MSFEFFPRKSSDSGPSSGKRLHLSNRELLQGLGLLHCRETWSHKRNLPQLMMNCKSYARHLLVRMEVIVGSTLYRQQNFSRTVSTMKHKGTLRYVQIH